MRRFYVLFVAAVIVFGPTIAALARTEPQVFARHLNVQAQVHSATSVARGRKPSDECGRIVFDQSDSAAPGDPPVLDVPASTSLTALRSCGARVGQLEFKGGVAYESGPPLTLGAHLAFQAEAGRPAPHSQAEAQGHELDGL